MSSSADDLLRKYVAEQTEQFRRDGAKRDERQAKDKAKEDIRNQQCREVYAMHMADVPDQAIAVRLGLSVRQVDDRLKREIRRIGDLRRNLRLNLKQECDL